MAFQISLLLLLQSWSYSVIAVTPYDAAFSSSPLRACSFETRNLAGGSNKRPRAVTWAGDEAGDVGLASVGTTFKPAVAGKKLSGSSPSSVERPPRGGSSGGSCDFSADEGASSMWGGESPPHPGGPVLGASGGGPLTSLVSQRAYLLPLLEVNVSTWGCSWRTLV